MRWMDALTCALIAGLALLLAACGGSPPPPPPPAQAQGGARQAPLSPGQSSDAPSATVAAQDVIAAARRAAAERLGIPPEQLAIERVESRDWSDSSLGCPQPGFSYAQVITPGYLIVISGAGQTLAYHADTRGQLVLCANPP
jgi:hypothetical protein